MAVLSDQEVVRLRRDLHRWPELGFLEFRTAGLVAGHLAALGCEPLLGSEVMDPDARMGLPPEERIRDELAAAGDAGLDPRWREAFAGGMTGVAARFPGTGDGPHRAFRFDLDALPVAEAPDGEHRPSREGFASRRPGRMHACGHDGHTAIGLALASRLAERPTEGPVTLVFQPAEEGLRGGAAVAASGLLDQVDELYCFHLGLGLPSGTVHSETVGLLHSDKLRAEFFGRAAHAGMAPEEGRNALLAAAGAVVDLQALPQYAGPGTKLNVGVMKAGEAMNVIAERATLDLETRAPDSVTGARLTGMAERVLEAAGAGLGVAVAIERLGGAPAVACDRRAAERVERALAGVEGLSLAEGPHRDSGSEDASWLLDRVRERGGVGTYVAVGCDSPAGHHQSRFDLDEAVLGPAVRLMERVARGGR